MWKGNLKLAKATFPLLALFSTCLLGYGQQNVIADKDNTHPEQSRQYYIPAKILAFTVMQQNGYNDVQWAARDERDTRRYIIEYSNDGFSWTTAGETIANTGVYNIKHNTSDDRSLLYRIRVEKKDGRYVTSESLLLEGVLYPPVKVYPTIITTNVMNLQIYLPVQRMAIVLADGRQVFDREIGGLSGFTSISIPSLPQGIYLVSFYGDGWRNTQRIMIER